MFQFTHARGHAFDLVTRGRVSRHPGNGCFHVEPGPPPHLADGGMHLAEFYQAGLIEDSPITVAGTAQHVMRLTVAGIHLDNRWRGDQVEAVIQLPEHDTNLTWNGKPPFQRITFAQAVGPVYVVGGNNGNPGPDAESGTHVLLLGPPRARILSSSDDFSSPRPSIIASLPRKDACELAAALLAAVR
jgi:hypothetical protein